MVAYVLLREGVEVLLLPTPNVHARLEGSRSFEHIPPTVLLVVALVVGYRIRRNILSN